MDYNWESWGQQKKIPLLHNRFVRGIAVLTALLAVPIFKSLGSVPVYRDPISGKATSRIGDTDRISARLLEEGRILGIAPEATGLPGSNYEIKTFKKGFTYVLDLYFDHNPNSNLPIFVAVTDSNANVSFERVFGESGLTRRVYEDLGREEITNKCQQAMMEARERLREKHPQIHN